MEASRSLGFVGGCLALLMTFVNDIIVPDKPRAAYYLALAALLFLLAK